MQEADVQVFRFTLGIPGFEDRYIPRVVGTLGLVLLALNHLNSSNPVPDVQARFGMLVPRVALHLLQATLPLPALDTAVH